MRASQVNERPTSDADATASLLMEVPRKADWSHDQHALILDAVSARIAVLDPDWTIISTNPAWREFALNGGFTKGESRRQSEPLFRLRRDAWVQLTVTTLEYGRRRGSMPLHTAIQARKSGDELLKRLVAAETAPDARSLIARDALSTVHFNEAACPLGNLSLRREEILSARPCDAYAGLPGEIEEFCDAVIAVKNPARREMPGIGNSAELMWIQSGAMRCRPAAAGPGSP